MLSTIKLLFNYSVNIFFSTVPLKNNNFVLDSDGPWYYVPEGFFFVFKEV